MQIGVAYVSFDGASDLMLSSEVAALLTEKAEGLMVQKEARAQSIQRRKMPHYFTSTKRLDRTHVAVIVTSKYHHRAEMPTYNRILLDN